MEWNRWPVYSRERQERVPFTQKNLHARYGQLDVALAMRDQRILYEAMKAPRRVCRSLRNRLTERFPAVPLTNNHSSYIEGSAIDAASVMSDEDAGGDAPWDLSKDPPGLQRSICKELFKTDSGSLHLDALDAHGQERNGSESTDKSAFDSSLCRSNSRTNSCSGFDQKDMVSTSVRHSQSCDMVGLPVLDGHICSSNSSSAVPISTGDINASNADEFSIVDRLTLLSNLSDKAEEECTALNEPLKNKVIESSYCKSEFPIDDCIFVSSLTVKTMVQSEGVSEIENDVKLVCALADKISHDSGPTSSCVHIRASENICRDTEKAEISDMAGDILEGTVTTVDLASESKYVKRLENESSTSNVFFVEGNCDKFEPTHKAPPDTSFVSSNVVALCSSMQNTFSPEQSSKLPVDLTASDVDATIASSYQLFTNTVDSETKASLGATSFQQDVLLNPCLADKAASLEEGSSSTSVSNFCSAVAISDGALNSNRLINAEKAIGGSELPNQEFNDCQGMPADTAVESLEFFPDLVFLGIDVASVSSLYHHNAVIFLPPTGGTIANPGTVLVDLPKEYNSMVEDSSVPPPIPPPLTLQEILALDLNLESITRYQAKPRSMYTFLCAQNFRRDEYPWHFKNVHSEIHGGLNGWIEARCPLACYGCTYSTRRLNPINCTVLYNSEVDCFGVRPNLSHCKSLDELSQAPTRAQKEATPEIYTSKDYDSAVNIKCRSRAKVDEALEGGQCNQVTDVVTQSEGICRSNDHDVSPTPHDLAKFNAESKSTIAERYVMAEAPDVLPSASDLSSDTIANTTSVDWDNVTNHSKGATVKGLEESLLLRMLPFEVLQHIARCLDSFSLCNLAMTSHFLREVCRSIVEHRGIVIQEWEKKEFDSGASWQVTYQRWLFSSAFTPCNEWCFEDSPSISEHLKVCSFNVIAEPRSQPFQLCCLSMAEEYCRNYEAEEKLQRMYPEFDPKSIHCIDGSSKMPAPEVLDHLYVNEIGKTGFSGYKRALKSFALSCSEQLRDTLEHTLGIKPLEQFGESSEPEMAIETSEYLGDDLEPKPETNASVESEGYLETELAMKSSERLGDSSESQQEIKTFELFENSLDPKQKTATLELLEDCLELKLEPPISEQFRESTEQKLEKSLEQFGDNLQPILETNTSEMTISEQFGESMEQKLDRDTSELLEVHLGAELEAEASEEFGDSVEGNLEPRS